MLYQLPNGRTIELSVEQYLEMTDEDVEYLIAYNHGEELNNPFFNSAAGDIVMKKDENKFSDYSDFPMELPDNDKLDIDPAMLDEE